MPRVLVKESNFEQLQRNQPYTIIIRAQGLIIKQITNDQSLENVLIVKIEPLQIKKLELQEQNKEYVLTMNFTLNKIEEYNCTFISLELPITILFDKLMKVIDPNYEETSLLTDKEDSLALAPEQNSKNFIQAVDLFVKKTQQTVSQPVLKGIEFIQLGMQELEKTIRSGFQSLTAPFTKKDAKEDYQDLINETLPKTEFLIQINKIFLNHVDSALEQSQSTIHKAKNTILLTEQAEVNTKELTRSTMVFIHPFGLDLSFWDPYLNYFYSKGFRVIAYDMRGWGGSEQHKNNDYKFNDYYKDLIEFLKQKNLLESELKLVLVTGSLSGLMLLNKVDNELGNRKNVSLVLLSSSDRIAKDIQELIKKMPPTRTWGPLKKIGHNKLKQMILTKEIEEPVIQEKLLSALLGSDNKVVMETFKNLKSDYTDGLSDKTLDKLPFDKILLITGEKDIFIPLSNIEHLKNDKKFKIQVIENGNHFIAFEKPELIIKEISEWLEERNISG